MDTNILSLHSRIKSLSFWYERILSYFVQHQEIIKEVFQHNHCNQNGLFCPLTRRKLLTAIIIYLACRKSLHSMKTSSETVGWRYHNKPLLCYFFSQTARLNRLSSNPKNHLVSTKILKSRMLIIHNLHSLLLCHIIHHSERKKHIRIVCRVAKVPMVAETKTQVCNS